MRAVRVLSHNANASERHRQEDAEEKRAENKALADREDKRCDREEIRWAEDRKDRIAREAIAIKDQEKSHVETMHRLADERKEREADRRERETERAAAREERGEERKMDVEKHRQMMEMLASFAPKK